MATKNEQKNFIEKQLLIYGAALDRTNQLIDDKSEYHTILVRRAQYQKGIIATLKGMLTYTITGDEPDLVAASNPDIVEPEPIPVEA